MPTSAPWILYGANGYTGRLLLEEALSRGHRPILAGRSIEAVESLARTHGLESRVFGLDDADTVSRILRDAGTKAVLHAAGPFKQTAEPMMQACLKARAHYMDITGEVPIFERAFELHAHAVRAGITLMPGVGFDVVPSDCLALHVSALVKDPTGLELAFYGGGPSSGGTTKTMVEYIPTGMRARRGGELVPIPTGFGSKKVRFLDHPRTVTPILWGDLATAFRSTGIPNITTYTYMPANQRRFLMVLGPVLQSVLRVNRIRRAAQSWVGRNVKGPDEETRMRARAQLWARAWNEKGQSRETMLETPEGYRLTALTGIRIVERMIGSKSTVPSGTVTPAQAFGADFILEIPDTRRQDA